MKPSTLVPTKTETVIAEFLTLLVGPGGLEPSGV
jgi:hypothetical protein